ncbi:hypothetical protein WICPIJ_003514 [Wickerhamomyces pijperi]|uniref:Uncharacterized protein n=1 Tax=Wickerhamomyces pijperi TaxID=599730 RepID=A0A9P8Q9P7_WICPI|nr:hypothetical protein WICPIJ_003514 [Wickerhamomyces pijperi]
MDHSRQERGDKRFNEFLVGTNLLFASGRDIVSVLFHLQEVVWLIFNDDEVVFLGKLVDGLSSFGTQRGTGWVLTSWNSSSIGIGKWLTPRPLAVSRAEEKVNSSTKMVSPLLTKVLKMESQAWVLPVVWMMSQSSYGILWINLVWVFKKSNNSG